MICTVMDTTVTIDSHSQKQHIIFEPLTMSPYHTVCIDLTKLENREVIGRIRERASLPTVLTVAGSDSSGGAGIEADIKTITAHNCYALTGIDALTAQNTLGVSKVVNTEAEVMESILEQDFADIRIDAIKTGVLTNEACLSLRKMIQKYNYTGPLVVDPVLVSTSGFSFVQNETLLNITRNLSEYITIITPNMVEAKAMVNTLSKQKLCNDDNMEKLEDVFALCEKIHDLTKIKYVLVKGGHQEWQTDANLLVDVLYHSDTKTFHVIRSKKMHSSSTHGTGCTLSAAIASNLANGLNIVNAVANGIVYVQQGIKYAPRLGSGCGPLNHLQRVKTLNYDPSDVIKFAETDCILDNILRSLELENVWGTYISHPFFLSIYKGVMVESRFAEFCVQNKKYLVAYSQVIALMISKTANTDDIQLCVEKLKLTVDEIAKYEKFIKDLGVTDIQFDNTEASRKCNEYTEALLDVANSSVDFLDIYSSLLPCTIGYYFASQKAKSQFENLAKAESTNLIFKQWTEGMDAPEWETFVMNEKAYLNQLFRESCKTRTKFDRLLSIIKTSVIKETEFLDCFV